MIEYAHELFGIASLFRIHGSAISRSIIPALFSTSLLIIAVYGFGLPIQDNDIIRVTEHPYAFQVCCVPILIYCVNSRFVPLHNSLFSHITGFNFVHYFPDHVPL